ncbi:hypothetical protein D3C71_1931090 [compost metagenome]
MYLILSVFGASCGRIDDFQLTFRKDRLKRGSAFPVELLFHQLGLEEQVAQLAFDTKDLSHHRQQQPAGRTRQIRVHASALLVNVFWNTRVHAAKFKVCA